jgi:hypothetical protein
MFDRLVERFCEFDADRVETAFARLFSVTPNAQGRVSRLPLENSAVATPEASRPARSPDFGIIGRVLTRPHARTAAIRPSTPTMLMALRKL